ncbi:hypothetical protein NCCP2222_04230 [Sporosarcina sp. NCCP-2222]|uniref:DUF7638 domain-containing protein n=1 Tax=Sporosarcina sp. NCCP-2222 TaxID=2935073 RepID=UPI002088C624|nr:hypothetical protein [Sporosarcina sp. NCCP-2222]GKV54476.1 hypothetical protein NCCP2222_04230 [Sporosarcina sp. NCCP-2222]
MQQIRRKKEIEGTTMPGIIQNGGQYFFVNLDVYEDGMANCWELVDLKGLKEKLDIGWLTPSVPVGRTLSIHGLGAYKIQSANWRFDHETYYENVIHKVKQLNPEYENIFTITKTQKEITERRKIVHSPTAVDFYVVREMFYETAEGKGLFIFMKENEKNYLVNMVVYKNGLVGVYHSDFEKYFQFDEVAELFTSGVFFTEFTGSLEVIIGELGEVYFSPVMLAADMKEKQKELTDMYNRLKGEKTTLEICREAYYHYLANPSDFNRDRLKEKYELVPEHERMYLGDMDSKDWDYQRIIYSPNEKREV